MSGDDTLRLWHHVYGEQPGVLALFSGVRTAAGDLESPRSAYFAYPAKLDDARGLCLRWSREGREAYHCAHLLSACRRIKANAAPLLALYADADGAETPDSLPPPTAFVESSPGRGQCYWRLSRQVEPVEGERLNRRLTQAMGADSSGYDLTQLLRPPGTQNHKHPGPPMVRVREITNAVYDPEELAQMLPVVEEGGPDEGSRERARQSATANSAAAQLADAELLEMARAAANGEKFFRLYFDGDTAGYATADNDGRSEADLALCSLLAFWCGPDEERVDRLFRGSALHRRKWDEVHYADGRTYGQGCTGKAIERAEFWSGRGGRQGLRRSKAYARRKGVVSVG